jgi:hypothetical protein
LIDLDLRSCYRISRFVLFRSSRDSGSNRVGGLEIFFVFCPGKFVI